MPEPSFTLTVTSKTLIKAPNPPPNYPEILPFSNLDLILGSFNVSFISIYPSNSTNTFSTIISTVRSALPAFLDRFFPFAGRIVQNPDTTLPQISCNNAGAELVVAYASVPLTDIDFTDVTKSLDLIQIPYNTGIALSLQVVCFQCGGFALSWGTNHILVDGHGLISLQTAWVELLRTGSLSWEPHHDRSFFLPRSPPRYNPSLNDEFYRYVPDNLVNTLMVATLVRRNYIIKAADVVRLRAAANHKGSTRRTTRLEAFSAHVWKLLAKAIGDSDPNCRLAWLVDGRRRLGGKYDKCKLDNYLGNVITYASREATVKKVSNSPLSDVAAMVGEAIKEVFDQERFEQLVDWMEVKKEGYKEGGKWTEKVGVGLGSPSLVISAFLPFHIEGDFGFGKPRLVMPWIRPGRLGSASMTVVLSPSGDGSWLVSTRMWPRLLEVIEADPEGVLKPATVRCLGFGPELSSSSTLRTPSVQVSRL